MTTAVKSTDPPKKIDKLTPQQIQLMHEHREQYIDFIVNNKKYYDPVFFSNQVKLHIYRKVNPMKVDIDWIYKKAGLKPPTYVFEADSYLQEKMMVSYIRAYTNLDDDSCVDEIGKIFSGDLSSSESSIRNEDWKHVSENIKDNYADLRELAVSLDRHSKSILGIRDQVCDDFIQRNNENKEISDTVKNHYKKFDDVEARHQVARCLFKHLTGGRTPFTTEDHTELNRILNAMRVLLDKDLDNKGEEDDNRKLKFIEQGFGLPWNSWMAFYSYFSRINVLNNKEFDRFFAFFLHHKIWSIQFFKHWVCFTRLPNKIYRDAQNRLHSTDGSCVEWNRPQDVNYFIHGVPFKDGKMWERVVTNKIPTKEVLSISNMELRNAILSVISPAKLISDTNAKLVDEYKTKPRRLSNKYTKNTEKKMKFQSIKLYRLDPQEVGLNSNNNNNNSNDGGGIFVLFYNDPSTAREYFSYVDPAKAIDAVTAMSSKFGLSKKEYLESIVAES